MQLELSYTPNCCGPYVSHTSFTYSQPSGLTEIYLHEPDFFASIGHFTETFCLQTSEIIFRTRSWLGGSSNFAGCCLLQDDVLRKSNWKAAECFATNLAPETSRNLSEDFETFQPYLFWSGLLYRKKCELWLKYRVIRYSITLWTFLSL